MAQTLASRGEELSSLEQRITTVQQQNVERLSRQAGDSHPEQAGEARLQPGQYAAGRVTAVFEEEGTFKMQEANGPRAVQGQYAVESGILTLSDVHGDTGLVRFPMRCRVQAINGGFRLEAVENSCRELSGVTFEQQG